MGEASQPGAAASHGRPVGWTRITLRDVGESGSTYNVLSLIERDHGNLIDPHYLAEYEAIILEPSWVVLGIQGEGTVGGVSAAEFMLHRRSIELGEFFTAGGLLVVWLIPVETRLSYTGHNYLDNHVWWAAHLDISYTTGLQDPLIAPGSGVSIQPVEPGHAFEKYLESRPKYVARLAQHIEQLEHVTVLATNRAGDPVAAEIAVGAGSIVIVPPPGGDKQRELLSEAINATLKTRSGLGFEWKVPEELELDAERTEVLRRLRDERRKFDEMRAVQQRVLAEVFKTIEVRRALKAWREATGPGATPKKAMYALHGMLEMLTGYFGTGRAEVAQTLGVSHKSMNRIAELANRRTLNLRHTMEGKPEDVDPDEYNRILAEAHGIVQAFINYSYVEAAKLPVNV